MEDNCKYYNRFHFFGAEDRREFEDFIAEQVTPKGWDKVETSVEDEDEDEYFDLTENF